VKPSAVLLLVLLLTGCAHEARSASGASGSTASPTAPSTPSPSALPTSPPTSPPSSDVGSQPDRSLTPACVEVRAGIDAFNAGDFDGTVQHFRTALPLARRQAAADSSASARDLLAAVRYYAELAPGDYLTSSATSPDFAKYKAITLGQCEGAGVQPVAPSESPGVTT
jgi:hypothetical protein